MLAASVPRRNVVWGAESGTDRLVVAHKAHKEREIELALCTGACPSQVASPDAYCADQRHQETRRQPVVGGLVEHEGAEAG